MSLNFDLVFALCTLLFAFAYYALRITDFCINLACFLVCTVYRFCNLEKRLSIIFLSVIIRIAKSIIFFFLKEVFYGPMAIIVKKRPGESDDQLISSFRRQIMAENLVINLKEKQRYEKPSARRHRHNQEIRRGKRR